LQEGTADCHASPTSNSAQQSQQNLWVIESETGRLHNYPPFEILRMLSVAEGCMERARSENKLPDDCRYEGIAI
jgi:hypothetical protein